jgi:hypothetical protein
LCEHGDDHIGGVANEFGPVPVLAERAVDVGRVENDEPLGLLATRVFPPDEHVGGRGIDRVGLAPPGDRSEAREKRGQIGAGGDAPGEAGDGMEAASGVERLMSEPTSELVIRLLPVFVPPQMAATSSGSRDTCGRNLP